jgi:hypothetical protein
MGRLSLVCIMYVSLQPLFVELCPFLCVSVNRIFVCLSQSECYRYSHCVLMLDLACGHVPENVGGGGTRSTSIDEIRCIWVLWVL